MQLNLIVIYEILTPFWAFLNPIKISSTSGSINPFALRDGNTSYQDAVERYLIKEEWTRRSYVAVKG